MKRLLTYLVLFFLVIVGISSCDKKESDCNGDPPFGPLIKFILIDSIHIDSVVVYSSDNDALVKYNGFGYDDARQVNVLSLLLKSNDYYLCYNNQYDTISSTIYIHEGSCWDTYSFDFYFNDSLMCEQCNSGITYILE